MKCVLASMGFINEELEYNKKVLIDTMIASSSKADIVIFGEAFLQGFYGATFDVEHDAQIAISQDDPIIDELCSAARQYAVAVSFGFIEREGDCFYSSQMTIDADGTVIDIYRRVSPGWKLPIANSQYCEGKGFHVFSFQGKNVLIGLCGDLWYDENISEIRLLKPDVVFWPVYTDFNFNEWNNTIKYEYASQAKQVCETVLYVNSLCKDKTGDEFAKGGAILFQNGCIQAEIPSGKEDLLLVEIE